VLIPKACKNTVEIDGRAQRTPARRGRRGSFSCLAGSEVAAGRLHDEAALADRLGDFRAEGEAFHEPSFDTISAAGANAAMCHYNHLDNEPAALERDSLYLVDSGGQYSDGTTDITRTVVIGSPSDEMRELFTLVLKGHIALDRARFPPAPPVPTWTRSRASFCGSSGRDYDHGTGHGVGAFLSVHEGPQRISKAWNATALAPGMIVSNEPGYYRDGAFGIRCENLCVVREVDDPARSGPCCASRPSPWCPSTGAWSQVELLDDAELEWLECYHARVAREGRPAADRSRRPRVARSGECPSEQALTGPAPGGRRGMADSGRGRNEAPPAFV
jgi:Xaa-Pro aminopeptidase